MARNCIEVDAGDALRKINSLTGIMKSEKMLQMEYRVVRDTGRKVKKIVAVNAAKKYYIAENVAKRDVRSPRMRQGADGVSCNIPLAGKKHIIGGNTFGATGGVYGWRTLRLRKRYTIHARILADRVSEIPNSVDRHGGNAPFRNIGAHRLNDATYVRESGTGFPPRNTPIARMTAVAVPQMPMNLARDDVLNDIEKSLVEGVEKQMSAALSRIR